MITDDATRKHLFQAPELVRDLVCTYVPHPWLSGLDFGTLEPVPSSFVSDEMRQFHSDVIWRVQAQGEWVYLYLLIEFQSRVDPHMALRVMTYLALLYQSLVRQNQGLAQHRLPPVLPLVLYNGEATWTAVMDMAQLIPELPEDLRVYTPSLRYVLVDEERHLPDQGADHALAHLMRFAHAREPGQQLEHLVRALKLVQNDAKLLEHVCAWVKAVAQQKEWLRAVEALGQVQRQGEFAMAFKWGIERWVEDKQEEWLQQGIGQGEGLLLQKLLSKRFGDLPPEMVQMIRSAEPKEIELWGERVLDAPSLQAVFLPLTDRELALAFKWGVERWVEGKQKERFQQGIEQGREQGFHRGIGQGEGLLLQRLLSKRFGDLPPEMVQMIRSAEPKEIELWGERVLDAPSLQAVFHPAH